MVRKMALIKAMPYLRKNCFTIIQAIVLESRLLFVVEASASQKISRALASLAKTAPEE